MRTNGHIPYPPPPNALLSVMRVPLPCRATSPLVDRLIHQAQEGARASVMRRQLREPTTSHAASAAMMTPNPRNKGNQDMHDPLRHIQNATRVHQREHGCGACTFEDGPALTALSMSLQPRRVLELGTALGYTACCLAQGCETAYVRYDRQGCLSSAPGGWPREGCRPCGPHHPASGRLRYGHGGAFPKL